MKKIYFISLLVILLSCKKEDTPTSPASTPTLVTSAVLNITESTASCGGYITSDGGKSISQRGICWSTNPVPTTSSNFTIDGSGIGTYSSSMNNLSSNTTYYEIGRAHV